MAIVTSDPTMSAAARANASVGLTSVQTRPTTADAMKSPRIPRAIQPAVRKIAACQTVVEIPISADRIAVWV